MTRQTSTTRTSASVDPEASAVQPGPSLDKRRKHTGVADTAAGGSTESYTVGYGRPPKSSQFKRGQSGNPKGRSKQSRNLRTVVKQVLNEDMQIREGDRLRRMPAVEALVRTTLARSFKGDPKALHSLIIILKQCGYGNDPTEPAADLLLGPEYDAIIADYLGRRTSANTSSADADPAKQPSIAPPEKSDGGKT